MQHNGSLQAAVCSNHLHLDLTNDPTVALIHNTNLKQMQQDWDIGTAINAVQLIPPSDSLLEPSVSDPTNFYNEDDFDIGKQICIAGKILFTSLQNQMAMKFLRNSQLVFEEF